MGCCNGRHEASRTLRTRSVLEINAAEIRVVEGDIAVQTTEAIVNSTNSTLTLDVGDADTILRKGGFKLRAECIEYVNVHGPLEVTEVAVTSGGALPCTHIIHVVAPVYVNGRRGEPENLRKALLSVLEVAESLDCTSISIPAISTMPYSYPKAECATILVKTTRTFLITRARKLKTINFVSSDRFTIRSLQKAKDALAREQCILDSSTLRTL